MRAIENRMVNDSLWENVENRISQGKLNSLPVCGYCEERILQDKALHISYGHSNLWLCDRCVKDLMEFTGFEEE